MRARRHRPRDPVTRKDLHIVNPALRAGHDFFDTDDRTHVNDARPVYVAMNAAGEIAGVTSEWQDAVEVAHGAGDPDQPLIVDQIDRPVDNPPHSRRAELALAKAGL